MTAKTLSRHYGLLTPEERFRLVCAATDRGDDAERDRLFAAAGRLSFRVPDTFGCWDGCHAAAQFLRTRQLELALRMNCALAVAIDWQREPVLPPGPDEEQAHRAYRQARTFAYLLVAHFEAARRFKQEYGFSAGDLTSVDPDLLVSMEREAADLAFTREEATAYLRERHPEAEADAVEDVLTAARAIRDHIAAEWK